MIVALACGSGLSPIDKKFSDVAEQISALEVADDEFNDLLDRLLTQVERNRILINKNR